MQTGPCYELDRTERRRVKPRDGAGNTSFTRCAAEWAMRFSPLPPLLLLGLVGCIGLAGCADATGFFAAANVASIIVFQRAIPDLVVSAVTGKDCSVVRLDELKSYCVAQEPPPPRPPYCTRGLATVDCWVNPEKLSDDPRQVADGPSTLTPQQEAYRTRRWGGL